MSLFIATYHPNITVGIANYLKVVFSCYRINSLIHENEDFKCIDKNFENIYSSIFKNSNMILYETENKLYENHALNETYPFFKNIYILLQQNSKKVYKIDGWRLYIHPNDNVNISPFANEWFLQKCNMSVDLRFNNIPKNIQEMYINIISKFEIHDKLINNVNSFLTETIKEDFLGVHIRTWFNNNTLKDNRSSNERYKHYLSVRDAFINNINKSSQNYVLICTDNRKEIKYIIDRIVNKKIVFYIPDPTCNYIQNDFSELLLLSKCSYLIGSLNSTFTELAWWYSKCSVMVTIL